MSETILKKADFVSNQEVRWCPGCGDYAILASVQKIMPELNIPRENIVFVAGIGCSGRFPYYMNTYGFHTIHGRAPAVATGLKITRPELSVWIVTGDGDALSIGGNHFMHILRRNVNVNILLFNNQIYGLTKGQYSPTSEVGKVTGTTPNGSIDRPVNPLSFALASGATFVARSLAIDAKHLQETLHAAHEHQGTSVIEILQNCNIYNDGTFDSFAVKDKRDEHCLYLENGQPLIYGKEKDKGLGLKDFALQTISASDNNVLIHQSNSPSIASAQLLTELTHPEFPVPLGIFRQIQVPAYETQLAQQVEQTVAKKGKGDLQQLLQSNSTWLVS